jgi:hypothetical protein
MVRNGKDVPENGPERENVILRYLLAMSERSTWGSTPEYFAAAAMTGKVINIWQRNKDGLFIINSVDGSNIPAQLPLAEPEEAAPKQIIEDDEEDKATMQDASADDEKDDKQPSDCAKLQDAPEESDKESVKVVVAKDAELDAMLYSSDDALSVASSYASSDDDVNYGSSYNLYFLNNHYQAMITREQYLKLVSIYGLDEFRNFRPFM